MHRLIRRLSAASFTTLIVLTTVVVPALAGTAPTTHWVDNDGQAGPDGCGGEATAATSIQAAVDTASSGDTILICPGEYVGPVVIFEKDDLTIRGVKPWEARLLASPSMGGDVLSVSWSTGTRIQWLEILAPTEGTCEPTRHLINIDHSPDTSIRANHLGALGTDTLGPCGFYRGIFVADSDGSVVAWNRIIDFKIAGILADQSANLDIHGNSARYLHAAGASQPWSTFGIELDTSPNARLGRNVVRGLPGSGESAARPALHTGIFVENTRATLVGNRVFHVDRGITLLGATGSVLRDNRVRHSHDLGLEVVGSNMRIRSNLVRSDVSGSNGVGVYEDGNVLRDNDFRGNQETDCIDTTGYTAETILNTWTGNLGHDSRPDGICTAP